jgi:hypothetical protein
MIYNLWLYILWISVCLDWRWLWRNHVSILILLKIKSIVFAKIMMAQCDSVKHAAIKIMHRVCLNVLEFNWLCIYNWVYLFNFNPLLHECIHTEINIHSIPF